MRRTRDNTRHNRQMEGAEQEVEQGAEQEVEQGVEQRNKVEEKTATTRPEVVSNVFYRIYVRISVPMSNFMFR